MIEPNILPSPDGAISEADYASYLNVIADALVIHFDRERVRDGLWKEYEAVDQVNSIKIKVDRAARSLEILNREPARDDVENMDEKLYHDIKKNIKEELLDIINYANFAVRQL